MPTRRPTSPRPRTRAASGPGRAPRNLRSASGPTLVIRPGTLFLAVGVLVALVVAPYLRPWVSQRAQINQAKTEIVALNEEIAQLQSEQARWKDDAFVRAQARERLLMVSPGEYSYTLVDDVSAAQLADPRQASVAVPEVSAARPWYSTLWGSVRTAGDPSTRLLPQGQADGEGQDAFRQSLVGATGSNTAAPVG